MAAAAIVPTVVQKEYRYSTSTVGTPMRLVKYFMVATKVTQADWIVVATYAPGTYIGATGVTIDGSSDGAAEVVTYTATGTKAVLGSANVGTVYLEVTVQE